MQLKIELEWMETKMSMNDLENLFKFIGGLGMFLYGMNIMADGLQKSAGEKMKNLLGILTNNRFLAVVVGALVTAVIQSSSATTVMVVGFVNAGILNLGQAVGVIMGANIGTTITAWLVSLNGMGDAMTVLKPEFFAPLLIGIGAFIMLFAKKDSKKHAAEILIGFGILFIGLSFMSGSIKPYSDSKIFYDIFETLGKNPLLGILAGLAVTALIQSSSASVGILQTLAVTGRVNWSSAIFITLGQNIGTCVTALISSAGAHKTAKRAAVIHLLFNVFGAILFAIIGIILFTVNREFANSAISTVQISIFHTIFNVTNTLIMFPFANGLVKASSLIIKDEKEEEKPETYQHALARHLDDRILESPTFAIQAAIKEIIHMGEITYENVTLACEAVKEKDGEKIKKIYETELIINNMEKGITEYLVKVDNLSLNEKQHHQVSNLFYTVSDIERVGDHAENIADMAKFLIKNDVSFSPKAQVELDKLTELVRDNFKLSVTCRNKNDMELVDEVKDNEKAVDKMEKKYRKRHIERLANKSCKPEAGVIFLDIISNLERISDHALNIVEYVETEIASIK